MVPYGSFLGLLNSIMRGGFTWLRREFIFGKSKSVQYGEWIRQSLCGYVHIEGEKKRGAVLICPGGGYHAVAKREAEPVAVQFNAAGFHAFVLRYRVAPHRYPLSLLDVSLAMSIIRENADKWNIYADKITVCGFSAGGHLAASLCALRNLHTGSVAN